MSPKSLPRSRINANALGRTDISQLNIHPPMPPGGWSSNGSTPSGMDMSLAGPGQPNGGQFMLPTDSIGFYTSQNGQAPMFPPASGSYAQLGYSAQDTANGHMYTNGGQADFNPFFDNGIIPGHLGEMQLNGGETSSLGNFSLNMNPRMGQANGISGLSYQQPAQPPVSAPTTSSCCAPAAQQQRPANESTRHTPTSSTNSLASNGGTANSKSCCSGSPVTASSSSSQHPMLKSESVDGGPGSVQMSSTPLVSSSSAAGGDVKSNMANGHGLVDQYGVPLNNQQVYVAFHEQSHGAPAWYRYPPEYGTVTAPLQPSQWRSGLTVTSSPQAGMFGDAMHQQQAYENATMQPSFAMQHDGTLDGDAARDDSHMCSCGDDCECVGCVAHPYNNATRDTVRSVWSLMDDASSSASSTKTATAATAGTPGALASHPRTSTTVDPTSPQQQAFTPSDTSGTSDDQVTLPAGDFLFVSYSVMGCEGEGLTCPCGDDCQCVGCTIHNNTL
ncbi:hypothetical protein SEUCBS139899_007141 [Sporothrix eucalyptigena]|uniref:Copper-activated transcription factor n=1 Tax=Sporothrix eucalyptigena TaxID=1812306 RepID=A0ABP0BHF3_9PEZI